MRYTTLLAAIWLLQACKGEPAGGSAVVSSRVNDILEGQSADMGAQSSGQIMEARYVSNGARVLVLDKYYPQLRLFDNDGAAVWSGGFASDTSYTDRPQSISARGDTVLVWQVGRVTVWVLEGDTLALTRTVSLDVRYYPLGAVPGCYEDWLLYARDDDQFTRESVPTIDYLHTVDLTANGARVRAIWSDARNPAAILWWGHNAATISRYGDRVVLWHRQTDHAGDIVELDCTGREVHSRPELALVTGDALSVKVPKVRALQWTTGLAAIPVGVIVALQRYSHDLDPPRSRTEIMWLDGERYNGSVLVERQWDVMDYDSMSGRLLLASPKPREHFVSVPLSLVERAIREEQ